MFNFKVGENKQWIIPISFVNKTPQERQINRKLSGHEKNRHKKAMKPVSFT